MTLFLPISLFLIPLALTHWILEYRRSRKTLPPGPRPLPIIGNAHQMPTETPQWEAFSEWRKLYGDIIYLNIVGQPILVINSLKVAKDLLEKRSTKYSDRPALTMCGKLVGFDSAYVMKNYDEGFRKQRKMASSVLGATKVSRYYALQERQAATLLRELLQNPTALFPVVHHRISYVVMRINYGYNVDSKEDPMVLDVMEMMKIFVRTARPGNFLVDSIPSLKHLPRWIPGSGFLNLADAWRAQVEKTVHGMYEWCNANFDNGKMYLPNFVGNMIEEQQDQPHAKEDTELVNTISWAAATTMGGGLDTSVSIVLSFFMAMVLNPEVQRKAQAELDTVVGNERLPVNKDSDKLPYIRSILIELLRWACVAPLAVPHALNEDDIYEGYHFRKGTIILPNIWHMLHDAEVYDAPLEFKPERFHFNEAEAAKVLDIVFGFGRRACPGRYFIEGTLFTTIATTLATCNIEPAKSKEGEDILPKYEYTSDPISFPKDFSVIVRARFPKAYDLLFEGSNKAEVLT